MTEENARINKPADHIFLAEYQGCFAQINATRSAALQTMSLLVGFALTGAVLMIAQFDELTNTMQKLFVDGAAAMVIIMLLLQICWHIPRLRWRENDFYWQLRRIEWLLGMQAVTRIHEVDNYRKKSRNLEPQRFDDDTEPICTGHYRKARGWTAVYWINLAPMFFRFVLAIALWWSDISRITCQLLSR